MISQIAYRYKKWRKDRQWDGCCEFCEDELPYDYNSITIETTHDITLGIRGTGKYVRIPIFNAWPYGIYYACYDCSEKAKGVADDLLERVEKDEE